jgi:uncharacterized membrane protein YsdA (DUF1294 family)
LIWLLAASFITFSLYGFDKAQSKRKGAWRVPENVLHILALSGGFVGGWIGRSLFHHKTKKGIFLFVLIIATIIHATIIWWMWGR